MRLSRINHKPRDPNDLNHGSFVNGLVSTDWDFVAEVSLVDCASLMLRDELIGLLIVDFALGGQFTRSA